MREPQRKAEYDYVRIQQSNGTAWIGQILQPNQNISTVGDRLDPTFARNLDSNLGGKR